MKQSLFLRIFSDLAVSNVGKENIVSSLVPIVFLSVIIRSRSRSIFLVKFIIESGLVVLEGGRWFHVLSLFLLSVFFLNFLDDVIILKVFLKNLVWHVSESFFADPKSWLFNNQVWIFFFFLNDFSRKLIMVYIVSWWRWISVNFDDTLSVGSRFENGIWRFFVNDFLWIVSARSRLLSRQ